jgi:hypothetical protein
MDNQSGRNVTCAARRAVLLGLGRYSQAWASLRREVADDDHPFGQVVRDLGIGLYFAELFDDARAVDVLTAMADRGSELQRFWVDEWANAGQGTRAGAARPHRRRRLDIVRR